MAYTSGLLFKDYLWPKTAFSVLATAMPPRKKAATTPPLQGCAITIGGTTVPKDALGGKSIATLKTEISDKGGSYVTKVNECTHIVLTEQQFNKASKKVEDAKNLSNIHIVSYDWLEKALASKTPVNESAYLLLDRSQNVANGTSNDVDDDTKASTSKKRKRVKDEIDEDEDEEMTRTTGNGKTMNVTKKLDMKIPLDSVLVRQRGSGFTVHIGDDRTIYDVTLNQSDSGKNANKFYVIQLLKTSSGAWSCWTRWGRVGEDGQTAMAADSESFDSAKAQFEKKFKDKTGNSWEDRATGPMRPKKYVFIERSYEDTDSEGEDELPGAEKRKKNRVKKEDDDDEEIEVVESKLPQAVQRLLKLIFDSNLFNATFDSFDYDAKKMPLGKLSKSSLMRGYEVLKTLSSLVGASGSHTQIETLSNQYLSLIPHVIKRNQRPPVLDNMDKIKFELELLEALTDMQLANDLMKGAKKGKEHAEEVNLLDRQFQGLGMQEMDPIDHGSDEFRELENYLTKSVGHTHGTQYRVEDIFRIERNGEHERFDKSTYAKVSNKNRRLLWHGSRATNFGGILSQGLRIAPPEVFSLCTYFLSVADFFIRLL